jgi:hypothetical protein
MQLKPVTAIAVLLLVVASLLVSGCTTSTTSNTNQTPSATTTSSATSSTATHAFLEKYLAYLKNQTANVSKVLEVTWINNTSARVDTTYRINVMVVESGNYTGIKYNSTYILLPTTQDAINFLNAMNKTAYSIDKTPYPSGGGYRNVTGHQPMYYTLFRWHESIYRNYDISIEDNLIKIETITYVGRVD